MIETNPNSVFQGIANTAVARRVARSRFGQSDSQRRLSRSLPRIKERQRRVGRDAPGV